MLTSTQHDIVIFPSFIEFLIFNNDVSISFAQVIRMAIVTFSAIMNDKKLTICHFIFSNCLTLMIDIINDKKGNNFMNDIMTYLN